MPAHTASLRLVLPLALALAAGACAADSPLAPDAAPQAALALAAAPLHAHASASDRACWGQATQVFARMGVMGEHARAQGSPRVGLRNLARALYEAGVLPDDSMQALGAFVASELGLTIEACM